MGDRNSILQLQNYVVGLAPNGLVLNSDGSLELERVFCALTISPYFTASRCATTSSADVSNRPIDLIATRLPRELVLPSLTSSEIDEDVVWVSAGATDRRWCFRARCERQLSLRYLPISNLPGRMGGKLQFKLIAGKRSAVADIRGSQTRVSAANRVGVAEPVAHGRRMARSASSNAIFQRLDRPARRACATSNESLSTNDPTLTLDARLMRSYAAANVSWSRLTC
jgi:hypothetical protein